MPQFVILLLPELQILQELLHGHLVQEYKVRLAELEALQLRHPCKRCRDEWMMTGKTEKEKERGK